MVTSTSARLRACVLNSPPNPDPITTTRWRWGLPVSLVMTRSLGRIGGAVDDRAVPTIVTWTTRSAPDRGSALPAAPGSGGLAILAGARGAVAVDGQHEALGGGHVHPQIRQIRVQCMRSGQRQQ